MKISRLVALAGSIITVVQIYLLSNEKKGICFNSGCEIVDSLTTIPPLFFNIGGFLFFQAVFWGLWITGGKNQGRNFIQLLLLAGLAAEGVLVSFQHLVAQTFCSYCLLILSLVVLLNILSGFRHFFTAAAVFGAVLIGFSSLQFSAPSQNVATDLDKGTFAILTGSKSETKHYLFHSSTCKYCEKVIESLQEGNSCTIRFNPIDEIFEFALSDVQREESYSTDLNKTYLKSLGLGQIPVLLAVQPSGFQIIKGEGPIKDYLKQNCTVENESTTTTTITTGSSSNLDLIPDASDGSCSVETDCLDPELEALIQ